LRRFSVKRRKNERLPIHAAGFDEMLGETKTCLPEAVLQRQILKPQLDQLFL